ncbi:hypothetical protein C2845_PM07G08400 [Panicum miliaceum]|uniref:DUF8039 domain-containing protein n=1 Tax=Panicum miliaceum TaxID=4540 RepID=A0A3L6SPM5_PANMI|nr:hypothetical protein C2845_PM07G08400 [Panicum miliaceum]
MELLRVASVHIPDGLCIPQSGHKSSYEEEPEVHVNEDYNIEDPPPEPDTIDLLTEPTKCSLLDGSGYDMELALATVYPNQETCHTVPVEYGYAVVQPTYVWANAWHINLPVLVGDEITTLGDALLQRIQWPRLRIVIPPRSRAPTSAATSTGTTSDGVTAAQCQQKQPQQKQPLSQHVGAVWTMANPKYKPGKPMLSEEVLKAAGPSCEALHAYFMEQSVNGANGIHAKVAASYFECDGELSITVGFNDLYDLFNLDSLDISLLRCWTLAYSGHMDKKIKTKSKTKPKLVHKTDFPDYKVPTRRADQGALRMVQGMLCEFILKEIIDPKGEFYDGPADNP